MNNKKILIIEDEPIIARNLEMILSARKYSVLDIIHTRDDALAALTSQKPNLVLLDLNLEGHFEGLEIADLLHNQMHIPFIFITSYASKEILDKAKIYCPLGYIVKPFDADEIYANIEIALFTHKEKNSSGFSFEFINEKIENPLTNKEYQVMMELTSGKKYKEIADDLSITINTLNSHVKNLYSKLDIHSRPEIAPFLREIG